MNATTLHRARRADWEALEALLARAGHDAAGLSADELRRLGELYRQASSDLAIAQRDLGGDRITAYLNGLVARGHATIYQGGQSRWRDVQQFYAVTFPRRYRELWPYTLTAFLMVMIPGIVLYWLAAHDPRILERVMAGFDAEAFRREVSERETWTEIRASMGSATSAFIMTNNIQVMFLAFAGGMTGGLLTLWILFSNGLMLGGIFGALAHFGQTGKLWNFVVSHGPVELSVIFLAGGCGLAMGDALLRPGLLGRGAALAERAHSAVQVILGAAPLLVIAGLIEGYISPSGLSFAVKSVVGLVTGGLLHAYWWLGGRGNVPAEAPASLAALIRSE